MTFFILKIIWVIILAGCAYGLYAFLTKKRKKKSENDLSEWDEF